MISPEGHQQRYPTIAANIRRAGEGSRLGPPEVTDSAQVLEERLIRQAA